MCLPQVISSFLCLFRLQDRSIELLAFNHQFFTVTSSCSWLYCSVCTLCSLVFLHHQWDKVQVPYHDIQDPLRTAPVLLSSYLNFLFLKDAAVPPYGFTYCFPEVAYCLLPMLPQRCSVYSLIKIISINISFEKLPKGHPSD